MGSFEDNNEQAHKTGLSVPCASEGKGEEYIPISKKVTVCPSLTSRTTAVPLIGFFTWSTEDRSDMTPWDVALTHGACVPGGCGV